MAKKPKQPGPEEFPVPGPVPDFWVNPLALLVCMQMVSTEPSRQALSHVYVDPEDRRLVGTNGHVMAYWDNAHNSEVAALIKFPGATGPVKTLLRQFARGSRPAPLHTPEEEGVVNPRSLVLPIMGDPVRHLNDLVPTWPTGYRSVLEPGKGQEAKRWDDVGINPNYLARFADLDPGSSSPPPLILSPTGPNTGVRLRTNRERCKGFGGLIMPMRIFD